MAKLEFSLACQPTDRTQPVLDGTLVPDGIDLAPVPLPAAVASERMLTNADFDGAEVSAAAYFATIEPDGSPFIAIPVFTARAYVHSTVYVNDGASIREPADLHGKAMGIDDYWSTPAVWIRGILRDRHGVSFDDVQLVVGEPPAAPSRPPAQCQPANDDRPLDEQLVDGRLDALVTTGRPTGYPEGPVERLFPDSRKAERAYFRETGIFPIHRVLVIRKSVYDTDPWVAQELFKVFDAAKERCLDAMDGNGLDYPAAVPWLATEIETTRELMGHDYWPYGIDRNRRALETLTRYAAEQGLTEEHYGLEDLFAPETFRAFTV